MSGDDAVVIADMADAFLRAGGALSVADWDAMSSDAKAAFISAGNLIRREQAALTGLAATNKAYALEMLADVDGGEAKIEALVNDAADRAARKVTG